MLGMWEEAVAEDEEDIEHLQHHVEKFRSIL